MRRTAGIILLFILLFSLMGVEALATELASPPIEISAEGAVLIEQETGKVLFQKQMNKKMYPASTTKIMTALLAIEHENLDDIVTVGKEVESIPEDSSKADLLVGENLSLSQLLYGLMLPSGNDVANTIAVHIGKKASGNTSLTEEQAIKEFAKLMNKRAQQIGTTHTNFVNPHGYHDENHYTTPWDMAMISREAMKNPVFKKIVKTPSQPSKIKKGVLEDEEEEKRWRNSNELIQQESKKFYPYAQGIKTGRTPEAGRCLASSAKDEGIEVIAVVLESTGEEVWSDSTKLLSYGIKGFEYHTFAQANEIIYKDKIKRAHSKDPREIEIIAKGDIKGVVRKEDMSKIKSKIISLEDQEINTIQFKAPIEKGEKLGEVTYFIGDEIIAKGDLVAKESIRKKGLFKPYWWALILVLVAFFIKININTPTRKRNKR